MELRVPPLLKHVIMLEREQKQEKSFTVVYNANIMKRRFDIHNNRL